MRKTLRLIRLVGVLVRDRGSTVPYKSLYIFVCFFISAAGVLFVGLGSLVFSLPQFVSDEYQYSHLSDRKPLCQPGKSVTLKC